MLPPYTLVIVLINQLNANYGAPPCGKREHDDQPVDIHGIPYYSLSIFKPGADDIRARRFCYSLRGEPWFGPRILPILYALRDTVSRHRVAILGDNYDNLLQAVWQHTAQNVKGTPQSGEQKDMTFGFGTYLLLPICLILMQA